MQTNMEFTCGKGAEMNEESVLITQFLLTLAMGKRLIAKSLLSLPCIQQALDTGTIVIVAGTTNGYAAEEILNSIGQASDFTGKQFFRGITLPPAYHTDETGRLSDEGFFPGDVVIIKGKYEKGLTVYDVADALKKGDVVLKGANALDLENRLAGILIGHPKVGTIIPVMQAVAGRRVELILPVGLEKRVPGNLNELSRKLSGANASGLRLFPVTGRIVTELDAISVLTGVEAELIAAGGVCGAEGCCRIAVSGNQKQLKSAENLIKSISDEKNFEL
jgi:hypothetical protein